MHYEIHVWVMCRKVDRYTGLPEYGREWRPMRTSDGRVYRYDTGEEAWETARLCYPGNLEHVRVVRVGNLPTSAHHQGAGRVS